MRRTWAGLLTRDRRGVRGWAERPAQDAVVESSDTFLCSGVRRAGWAPAARTPAAKTVKASKTTTARPQSAVASTAKPPAPAAPSNGARQDKPPVLPLPLELMRRAIEEASDEKGWAHWGAVGSYMTKSRPDLDPRLYGHRNVSELFTQHARHFALEERGGVGASSKTVEVGALA